MKDFFIELDIIKHNELNNESKNLIFFILKK